MQEDVRCDVGIVATGSLPDEYIEHEMEANSMDLMSCLHCWTRNDYWVSTGRHGR